jgi:hypothetical protein
MPGPEPFDQAAHDRQRIAQAEAELAAVGAEHAAALDALKAHVEAVHGDLKLLPEYRRGQGRHFAARLAAARGKLHTARMTAIKNGTLDPDPDTQP